MSSIQLSSCTYISCCYCAWNVKWAYTNGGQCFYRVIFPPRNETVQELYLDKCNFIYRRLSRGRRLENLADSPRICPCPQCGGLAVSCAARRGEQRGSGQSVGGGAGGENTENTVSMGPHLATVTILLANIALAASELSTAGRYYYPWSMQSEQYKTFWPFLGDYHYNPFTLDINIYLPQLKAGETHIDNIGHHVHL